MNVFHEINIISRRENSRLLFFDVYLHNDFFPFFAIRNTGSNTQVSYVRTFVLDEMETITLEVIRLSAMRSAHSQSSKAVGRFILELVVVTV